MKEVFPLPDGGKVEVEFDANALNPRHEFDNFGTMVCFHRKYDLGDKHSFASPESFQEFLDEEHPIHLPVYLMDHSGLRISTNEFSCLWDSGQVGWIYCDAEKIRKEFGSFSRETIAKVYKILEQEVKTYDDFITGSVYGFVKYDADNNEIDSCWGFFGDDHKTSGLFDQAGVEY